MDMPKTARAHALWVGILLLTGFLYQSPGYLYASTDPASAAANAKSHDLLQQYQEILANDPDGSVQQRRKLGPLSLLSAVETSLTKSLNLIIQKETVNIAEGQYQSQGGAFALMFTGGISYGLNATKLDSVAQAQIPYPALDANQTTTTLTLSKQLRTGPALSLSSQLLRNDYKEDMMALYAGAPNPKTTAIVKLEAKVPLLNGAGHLAASAETAARLGYEAEQYTYQQAISENTLAVVQKYWDYRAAFFAYDVNLSIQGMLEKWLEQIQNNPGQQSTLSLNNQQQTIVLSTLRAKLADASRETSISRQNITTTRQALAMAMGIDATDFGKLAIPSDNLDVDSISLDSNKAAYQQHLTTMAMDERSDLKSLSFKIKAADALIESAENNLKPHLDLIGNIGYTGINENSGIDEYLSAATDRQKGESWAIAASFSYPLGNQAAKGNLLSQNATRRITAIQQSNLIRQIKSQLTIDIASLEHWHSSYKSAQTSVQQYWKALNIAAQNPIKSNSDLTDLLDLQDKLRDANINRNEALNSFAKAIASIRFNSGTLVEMEEGKTIIDLKRLTTPP